MRERSRVSGMCPDRSAGTILLSRATHRSTVPTEDWPGCGSMLPPRRRYAPRLPVLGHSPPEGSAASRAPPPATVSTNPHVCGRRPAWAPGVGTLVPAWTWLDTPCTVGRGTALAVPRATSAATSAGGRCPRQRPAPAPLLRRPRLCGRPCCPALAMERPMMHQRKNVDPGQLVEPGHDADPFAPTPAGWRRELPSERPGTDVGRPP